MTIGGAVGANGRFEQAIAAARLGVWINTLLAATKVAAGLIGSSYALVADGIESASDVLGSAVVWRGLRIAGRDPNERYPYGYGKAEPLAALAVGALLLLAAVGIGIQAIREIVTPHRGPAPFTLAVVAVTIAVKQWLSWRTRRVAREVGSRAVAADALHHASDALTSTAAAIGITIALVGGPGWEPADDWAALVASFVVGWTGYRSLRPAAGDLMDRAPGPRVVDRIAAAAAGVQGVERIEKLHVRRAGLVYFVDIHVHADGAMPLVEAHALGGAVKAAIRAAESSVAGVTVHMEPSDQVGSK